MQEDQRLNALRICPHTVAGYGVPGRQQDVSADVQLLWQGGIWRETGLHDRGR